MITLRQLEIFNAAARHGSFRQCAEHLGVSQVAVSEHIHMLEDRLGCALFERRPGGPATLTRVGHQAALRVSGILSEIDDFVSEIGRGRHDSSTISVAIAGFLMRNLHEPLADFTRLRPNMKLRLDLEDHSAASMMERVRQRSLDLAYFFTLDDGEAPGSIFLRHEPLAVFVSKHHPLSGRETVHVSELSETPVIHLSEGNSLRILVERVLARVGAGNSPLAIESPDFGVLLSTLLHSRGFICMFKSAEAELASRHEIVRLNLEPALPPVQVRMAVRRTHPSAIVAELRALIGTAETEVKDEAAA